MRAPTLNFVNQDLRNRSFRAQSLHEADFRGADLRGCDFSRANLNHADLRHAHMGQSRRQQLFLLILLLGTVGLVGQAVSQLIFAALGQTPSDRGWQYVIALYISLSVACIPSGWRIQTGLTSAIGTRLGQISGMSSAALIGFFYGGSLAGHNSTVAIISATVLGIGVLVTQMAWPLYWLQIVISVTAAVAGYGLTFSLVAAAAACWIGGWLGWGIGLSLLAMGILGLTIASLRLLIQQVRYFPGTSFRRANLTQAKLDGAILQQTDFTETIGLDIRL